MIDQVKKCPSGALSYLLNDEMDKEITTGEPE
jgi:hypothetical protein